MRLADRRPFDRSTAFLARRTWVSTGSAQVQNFANAFPSRREGRIFLRPRYVSLAWSQAADQYSDLSNGVRAAASSNLHYPDAEPHITLGVTLPSPITTPVNGLGALISLIFRRQWTVPRPVRLAFVNASEAGVPDQPMASLLSVKGVSPNCPEARMRAVLTARAGRRARSVGCRGPCVFERLMYLAAFFLIGNVRDLSGKSELVGQNSGRERNSLIRAEISLIADLNSLQGCKKFPVRMRRELARKVLI